MEYRKASNNSLIRRFDYTYDSASFIATQKVYDESEILIEWREYDYDTLGRLTKATVKDAGGSVTDTKEYPMDDVGNRTAYLDDSTSQAAYIYDANGMNQLTKIKTDEDSRSNPSVNLWGTYSADTGASVTLLTVDSQNAPHSNGIFTRDNFSITANPDQTIMARITDSRGYTTTCTVTVHYDPMADVAFAYDLRGNMVYKSEEGSDTVYIYDQRDNLREAYLPNGDQVLMEYGPNGQLLRRKFYDISAATWTTSNYLQLGAETITDFDGSWNLQAYYVPGLMLDHIEVMHEGGADYYFVRDHLGSVRLVLDANADIIEKYEYSDYGELTIKDAYGTPLTQSAIGNRITYTSREWDAALGLYYYRARWYDPTLARFTQKDIMHFTNRYIYVSNNSINKTDPFGLYDSMGHLALPEVWAKYVVGIDPRQAEAIAWSDQWIDWNPKTNPYTHQEYHFDRSQTIDFVISVYAAVIGNVGLFGGSLHTGVDSPYAHKGFPKGWGHFPITDIDIYNPCSIRDREMKAYVLTLLNIWKAFNQNRDLSDQVDKILRHKMDNFDKYWKSWNEIYTNYKNPQELLDRETKKDFIELNRLY